MANPSRQLHPTKRLWTILLGLGLIAGVITYFLTPSADDPALPDNGAAVHPDEGHNQAVEAEDTSLFVEAPPTALKGSALAEYDIRLSTLAQSIRSGRETEAETRLQVPALLESAVPMDQVTGLALMSGMGPIDTQRNYAQYLPEVVLAAVDLSATEFNDTAARSLLDQWMADMGGPQTAAEMAHNLLIEARLPYGGGSTALDLMIGVNDPPSIFVGLFEFAVNPRLPGPVRTEALVRMRDHVEPAHYEKYVRECVELARERDEEWANHAEQLLE